MEKQKKIAYVLGTKAQFIKSKYILSNLVENGFELTILDTGQHIELTSRELKLFGKNYNHINLTNNSKNISKIRSMLLWFIKFLFFGNKITLDNDIQYCLIHGDTVSTLMGLVFSKRNNLKTIHIEAGYKSHNLFKPFPEEIVRSIVSKYANIVSVDGEEYLRNIKNINNKKLILLKKNTIFDSVNVFLNEINIDKKNILTITIHRTENIYNKKRLRDFIELLIKVSEINKFEKIQWFCHDITINALTKNNLVKPLEDNCIKLKKLLPHKKFLNEIINSKAVITDGGSIAEECFIINQNTLIWRDVAESKNYLNKNVILSNYDESKSLNFLKSVEFKYPINMDDYSPSKDFVTQFLSLIQK